MGADQQHWDYGVIFTGLKSKLPAPLRSATTHQLRCTVGNLRWQCACGYKLGDGRKKFLARCPAAKPAYIENSVSSATNEKKPTKVAQSKARRTRRTVSQRSADFFS